MGYAGNMRTGPEKPSVNLLDSPLSFFRHRYAFEQAEGIVFTTKWQDVQPVNSFAVNTYTETSPADPCL